MIMTTISNNFLLGCVIVRDMQHFVEIKALTGHLIPPRPRAHL